VVGKWVWIQFSDKQPPTITSVLSELGFHWNNTRQAWQHPCGTIQKERAAFDPLQAITAPTLPPTRNPSENSP
jgi:hypothetical protein